MPTDYSGAARAAKLRRISASQGPVPAVRANIGSQALDAQLGGMDCCPIPCNPQVYWENSPIQLTLQITSDFEYSAQYATTSSGAIPQFGIVTGYTPNTAFIVTNVTQSGNSWTVIFTSDVALSGSFTCLTAFTFACDPTIIISKTFTFNT